jgi:hypothetical protein
MSELAIILVVWLSLPLAATAYFVYVDYFGPPAADYEKIPPLMAFLLALGWPVYLLAVAAWMAFCLLCSLISGDDP